MERSLASRTRRAFAREPSPSLSRPRARLSTSCMNGSHSVRSAHPAALAVSMAEERAAAWSRSFWVSRRSFASTVSSHVASCPPDAGVTYVCATVGGKRWIRWGCARADREQSKGEARLHTSRVSAVKRSGMCMARRASAPLRSNGSA